MRLFIATLLCTVSIFAGKNLEITSDDFFYKDGDNKATFSGHVVATQKKNIINSDKLIVFLDEKNEAKKYKAIGNVYFEIVNEKKDINGTCDTLTYLPKLEKYILIGNVKIDDRKKHNKVLGDEVVIDDKKGTSTVKSNSKKPVKFIFKVKSDSAK